MRTLLWSYLGWRRFPRELSAFEVRRFSRWGRRIDRSCAGDSAPVPGSAPRFSSGLFGVPSFSLPRVTLRNAVNHRMLFT
jgi:hypothetical protein